MRNIRICIYGGTDLKGAPVPFISELAYSILKTRDDAVIVTGGFRFSHDTPEAISTDVAALRGAQKFAAEQGISLKECFEAWIPEPALDNRRDEEGVERMSDADGITTRTMAGRTPLGRRLAMVAAMNLVITISGRKHTEVVIEQALELGVPVFPVPFAGGDSKTALNRHRARIESAFEPGALEKCLSQLEATIQTDISAAASAVVSLIATARFGKCLVLCPFDDVHKTIYESIIEPEIRKHMIPLRLDLLPVSNAISSNFADAIQTSLGVIVDITVANDNVMYEIGYAHALKMVPLIYTREASRLADLPVYLRTLNIKLVSDKTPLQQILSEYIESIRPRRSV
ncbi:hypothetical protein [Foetidibacter luteolus]|uniref:hypothetical protein n=1 Tax=Foetidibacter luteolus TaxID=2608880 RepID=UPI00129AAE11|nr:hypothetical protein [Foetidibacter luteolus]